MRILLFSLLLTGCISRQKCADRYPPLVSQKDSTIIIVQTHTINVPIQGETIILTDTLPCPDYFKEVKSGVIKASVSIKKGLLKVECKTDSLNKVISYKDSLIQNISVKTLVHTEYKYKNYWYLRPLIWYFIISLIVICLLLVYNKVK